MKSASDVGFGPFWTPRQIIAESMVFPRSCQMLSNMRFLQVKAWFFAVLRAFAYPFPRPWFLTPRNSMVLARQPCFLLKMEEKAVLHHQITSWRANKPVSASQSPIETRRRAGQLVLSRFEGRNGCFWCHLARKQRKMLRNHQKSDETEEKQLKPIKTDENLRKTIEAPGMYA